MCPTQTQFNFSDFARIVVPGKCYPLTEKYIDDDWSEQSREVVTAMCGARENWSAPQKSRQLKEHMARTYPLIVTLIPQFARAGCTLLIFVPSLYDIETLWGQV